MAGYNTEITHLGANFHVQTQDKGPGVNYVESIIYKSGRVLSSRKSFYAVFLNKQNLAEKIKLIIEEQHNAILKEISEGKFDHL